MTASEHLRMIELRKLHLGETLPATASAHAASCTECRARLQTFAEEDRLFLATTNVGVDTAKILDRSSVPQPRPFFAKWMMAVPALALAILFALVLIPKPPVEPTRIKGGSIDLEMFVKDAQGIHAADDGVRLREGDAIQFRYRAGGRRFVFVVSVGADGAVSPLYPDDERTSIPVSPSGTHVLEGSVILDGSRGPERFFAFFSDEPINFSEVQRAVEARLSEAIDDSGVERDVTRLQEVEIGREDVDETSVLIFKE